MIRHTHYYILLALLLLLTGCGGASNKRSEDVEERESVKKRMSLADSLYVAAAFKTAKRSTTFLPNDSIHDFGLISDKRRVSHRFTFTNKGTDPVVIDTVKSHCGCTTSSYTRQPVMPGKTGTVIVTYDPTDHQGGFRKTATLVLNGGDEYQEVKVVGRVKDRY